MKYLIFGLMALCLTTVEIDWSSDSILPLTLLAQADARPHWGHSRRVTRRVARRTARRVARRHYYSYLPSGCYWASPYYSCAGVYYRPVVEDGVTVYIIVH